MLLAANVTLETVSVVNKFAESIVRTENSFCKKNQSVKKTRNNR